MTRSAQQDCRIVGLFVVPTFVPTTKPDELRLSETRSSESIVHSGIRSDSSHFILSRASHSFFVRRELRIWRVKPWGVESPLSHQQIRADLRIGLFYCACLTACHQSSCAIIPLRKSRRACRTTTMCRGDSRRNHRDKQLISAPRWS